MARLSKTARFAMHEDTGIPTPDNEDAHEYSFEDTSAPTGADVNLQQQDDHFRDGADDQASEHDADDADDEADRQAPRLSMTSISSFPNSTLEEDRTVRPGTTTITPIIRTPFRRPESVQRMRMNSPRTSILSYYGSSHSETPHSAQGSPKHPRRVSEVSEEGGEEGRMARPLALLHVMVLPVRLPWSLKSMEELVPPKATESLQLLRSKLSDTVLERGILIRHPKEEYELLEERLLEALELEEERVTKCGHFRSRYSVTSESGGSCKCSDSGLGSSSSSVADTELCATCQHEVFGPASLVKKGGREWSVKVFAANGLMPASTWAAAWQGMESVDVEILPWISEGVWEKLDQRWEEEEIEMLQREAEAAIPADQVSDDAHETENLTLSCEKTKSSVGVAVSSNGPVSESSGLELESVPLESQMQPKSGDEPTAHAVIDLPPVFPRAQIPISTLLKNYIRLLAQDWRNVTIFLLAMLAICLLLNTAHVNDQTASVVTHDTARGREEPASNQHWTIGVVEGLGAENFAVADAAIPTEEMESAPTATNLIPTMKDQLDGAEAKGENWDSQDASEPSTGAAFDTHLEL